LLLHHLPLLKMKAAKKKVITLPPMLANASITGVVLEKVTDKKVLLEAIQVSRGKALMTAKCSVDVGFEMLKVDQICMLCSMWKLKKKYRSATRDEICLLFYYPIPTT
jgi:hypothetical protein